ncbi:hypothetical protein Avbf_15489 [Armadillidium vulgare]|nr:hypothetical protein Avbf_15489 [Armadillidium vulgare]
MMKNISAFVATSLLIQVIIFFDLTSSMVVYNCNPMKQCQYGNKGFKYRDPIDCFNYYICLTDSQGNYFASDNPCVNLCQTECPFYNYEKVADFKDCSSYYLCSPGGIKTHHRCPPRTPYFDGSDCSKESYVCCECCDECTPYCYDSFSEIADPYDCRSYYLCPIIGFPTDDNRNTCKEGKYFNASLGSLLEVLAQIIWVDLTKIYKDNEEKI